MDDWFYKNASNYPEDFSWWFDGHEK